jgi:predicted RNase H-like HicB family nuclease
VIQYDAESQAYVGFIPALPGTHSCAASLEELRANLREAVELMLETMADDGETPVGDIQVLVEPIELPA